MSERDALAEAPIERKRLEVRAQLSGDVKAYRAGIIGNAKRVPTPAAPAEPGTREIKKAKRGRPKGSGAGPRPLKLRANDAHVSLLARPWTPRILRDMCFLAFGTDDMEKEGDPRLIAKDPWLRFAICKHILDRGWGRAPQEVNIQVQKTLDVRYTPQELRKLTLEQISAIWRERIAPPTKLIEAVKVEPQ
jgi:hypothetical protein